MATAATIIFPFAACLALPDACNSFFANLLRALGKTAGSTLANIAGLCAVGIPTMIVLSNYTCERHPSFCFSVTLPFSSLSRLFSFFFRLPLLPSSPSSSPPPLLHLLFLVQVTLTFRLQRLAFMGSGSG